MNGSDTCWTQGWEYDHFLLPLIAYSTTMELYLSSGIFLERRESEGGEMDRERKEVKVHSYI